eukprot:2792815-Ditylum_brightwellii.AAC.1
MEERASHIEKPMSPDMATCNERKRKSLSYQESSDELSDETSQASESLGSLPNSNQVGLVLVDSMETAETEGDYLDEMVELVVFKKSLHSQTMKTNLSNTQIADSVKIFNTNNKEEVEEAMHKFPEELLTVFPHREYFVGHSEDCMDHRLHSVAEGQSTALGVVNTISNAHESSSESDSDTFWGLPLECDV